MWMPCLRFGMWVARRHRVKVTGTSGALLKFWVMPSLRGRRTSRWPGRMWRSRGGTWTWRRCGPRCVVLMRRVSPTRVRRWGPSSERARVGAESGLRSSGRLTGSAVGRTWRSESKRRSWSRCGRSCGVLVMRASHTPASRWRRSSATARRGAVSGLRSSGRGSGLTGRRIRRGKTLRCPRGT